MFQKTEFICGLVSFFLYFSFCSITNKHDSSSWIPRLNWTERDWKRLLCRWTRCLKLSFFSQSFLNVSYVFALRRKHFRSAKAFFGEWNALCLQHKHRKTLIRMSVFSATLKLHENCEWEWAALVTVRNRFLRIRCCSLYCRIVFFRL